MDKDRRDRKQKKEVLDLLKNHELATHEMPTYLRRHLWVLEKEGKITLNAESERWNLVTEEVIK